MRAVVRQSRDAASIEAMFEKYGERYRWLAVWTVMLAATSMVLATTIVNVAVPQVMETFRIGQETAQWLSTGFLAAMSTTMLMTSWCVRAFGQRMTYLVAMIVFIAMSLIGGLGDNAGTVIVSRILEGAAGGIIQPLAMIVIFQVFPANQRGRAMGIYGLGVVLSPAIGPVLGGLLVYYFSWRAVFFVVLPFCLVGAIMAPFFLVGRDSSVPRPAFDWTGFALLILFVVPLLIGLKAGREHGWLSPQALLLFADSGCALLGFIWREVACSQPLLNLRTFANRQFSAASVVSFAYGMGIYGSTYLIPLFVQTVFHYTPIGSGLLLAPGGLVLAGAILIAGRLTDRYSAHWVVAAGLICFGISFCLFAGVQASTAFWAMAWWIILGRVGLGLIIPALNAGAVQTLGPELLNQGSGAINFVRQLGGAFGVTIFSSVLEWRTKVSHDALTHLPNVQDHLQSRIAGFQDSFLVVALVFGAALLPAWFMRRKGGRYARKDSLGL